MKCQLEKDGTLVIQAENTTEAFALSHWMKLWDENKVSALIQTTDKDRPLEGATELKNVYRAMIPKKI